MDRLTKRALKERLGISLDTELALFFGISQSAVSQWDDEAPVPELRQLQAERKRPDLFDDQRAA